MKSKKDKVLAALPGSARDIVNRTGTGRTAVFRCLEQLHEDREIHVIEWRRTHRVDGRGRWEKVYALGKGVDVAEPQRKSAPKKTLLTEEERRERRVQREGVAVRKQANEWADKAAAGLTVDPLMAALYGRAA